MLTYDRIITLCMSEFGIYDLDKIETMTLTEFNYRMYALEYERLKHEHDIYKLAFAIRDAKATRTEGSGKNRKDYYKYQNVNDILNLEKNIKRLNKGLPIELENADTNKAEKPSLDVLKQIKELNKK